MPPGLRPRLLENQLGAREGPGQLQRYQDYVTAQDAESRTLAYMTIHERSDFEPSSDAVYFRSRRWFDLYDWLDDHMGACGVEAGRAELLTGNC